MNPTPIIPYYRPSDATIITAGAVNAYSMLALPPYWRAINFLAGNLASFPRSVAQDNAKANDRHPLSTMLRRRPNAYQNPTQFWRTLYYHAAHGGNGYAEIERGAAGRPVALHNRLPEDVLPFRYDDGEGSGPMQYYCVGRGDKRRVVPGDDMLHLSSLSHDGQCGIDTTQLFTETFQGASILSRFTTKYLVSGTMIHGAIEIPTQTTPLQEDEIANTINTQFRGINTKGVIILSGGAKFNNQTLSVQESQIVQLGAATTKAICQITGVPPQFVYEFAEAKYNNATEAMGQDVVRYTFRPWIEQSEDELSLKLLTLRELDQGYTIHINPDALLRGDTAAVNASAVTLKTAGIATDNESRAIVGLPPDPDPESDKRHTLGASTPAAPAEVKPVAQQAATDRARARAFAIVNPVLAAAVARVEAKTTNAVEAAANRTGDDRTRWGNAFAEGQARYVVDALAPVADALATAGGPALPVEAIAQRYAADVRARVAGAAVKGLAAIVTAAATPPTEDQQ